MNLFLDTNILIDLTGNRKPFAQWAYKIFKDQKNGKWNLFTSSFSILTTYYVIEKQIGNKKAKRALKILLSRVDVLSVDKPMLLKGIITAFNDYEDAMQHECALSSKKIDILVTRNKRDYKNSLIPVKSSEELYS